jgi:hypothetical protein
LGTVASLAGIRASFPAARIRKFFRRLDGLWAGAGDGFAYLPISIQSQIFDR